MIESQWKLRQQHDQNFPMERIANTSIRRKEEIQKSKTKKFSNTISSRAIHEKNLFIQKK